MAVIPDPDPTPGQDPTLSTFKLGHVNNKFLVYLHNRTAARLISHFKAFQKNYTCTSSN
jgi:hypothetical protein